MVNYGHQVLLLIAFRETKSQRKPVLMLSTCAASGVGQVQTAAGLLKQKPKCVAAYNPYMGDVDINDRKIYQAERPTKRYWKNAFFNVNDMALLNSYKLYRGNTRTVCGLCKTRHDFLCSIVESLCDVLFSGLESCYANRIYVLIGVELRPYGQKLVKF